MIRGRIIGEVWATKKHPGLEGRKLVLVAVLANGASDVPACTGDVPEACVPTGGTSGSRDWRGQASGARVPTGEVVVAIDTLEARHGQEVLVSWGSGARNVLQQGVNTHVLGDAAISAILAETFEPGH